ncbi:enoyl-CoA hydratase/isomerase family protein [Candidimonas nitroreducens]|uniref:Enoyl-CoA hydratase n=1 Tax=Candidimonas nitroreducens TaxID=683354 RepID=A0A225MG08_9BURK|nr:enoyl-CoA hydratase/isomerase family protein [Candidimonas nitroreducens]OWT60184.1 enoyl-CoA hydratase [Candidimonas nitroreducens]
MDANHAEHPPTAPKAQPTGHAIVDRQGPVTIITLHYPKRRNALSMALRASLIAALQGAHDSPDCRVIILTGSEGNFCSGGDISSFEGITPAGGRARMRQVQPVVRLIAQSEKPVIAAVEGHAAGAGICIASDCDIVVAADDAKFTCSFNKIGLFPDLGGLWSIPARVGVGTARKLMLTGRTIDGQAAYRCGLADELCPSGKALEVAIEMAREIAARAPLSNAMIKSALLQFPLGLEEVMNMEANNQGLLYATEDFQEGKNAFLEKRPPEFKGR